MKNFHYKHIKLPTPKKWRRIGNSLLAVSGMTSGFAFIADYKYIAIGGLILGILGKFLTTFFKEEK